MEVYFGCFARLASRLSSVWVTSGDQVLHHVLLNMHRNPLIENTSLRIKLHCGILIFFMLFPLWYFRNLCLYIMFPDWPPSHNLMQYSLVVHMTQMWGYVFWSVFEDLSFFLISVYGWFVDWAGFKWKLWIAVGKSHLAAVKKTHFVIDSIEMQPRQIGFFLFSVSFPRLMLPWT